MIITKNVDGGSLTILLDGRLDTSSAPQLEKELQDALPGIDSLALDLEKLVYISSAGLRVLLMSQKHMNKTSGTMVVRNVNEVVSEVFDVTGFSDVLTIEEYLP